MSYIAHGGTVAFPRPINCNNNPIEDIQRELLQRMSDAHTSISGLISNAENLVPNIQDLTSQGSNLLQDLLNSGSADSNIKTLADLSTSFGIDGSSSQLADEELLRRIAGIIMIGGVLFKKGEDGASGNNIEVLRRIYQGVGRDLTKVEQIYKSNDNHSFVFQTVITTLQPATAKTPPSLEEIRRRLNIPHLAENQIVYTDKAEAIVVYREIAGMDEPLNSIAHRINQPTEKLTSTIIHYSQILTTTASINAWISLGYQDKISYILDGDDPIDLIPVPISDQIESAKATASSCVTDIDFILSRISSLQPRDTASFKSRMTSKLDEVELSILEALNTALFKVSVLEETDTLTKLREKLSDADIVYLLDDRQDVAGIDFSADEASMLGLINAARSIRAGDITASSQYLNTPNSNADDTISTLLEMFSALRQAKSSIVLFTQEELLKAKDTLITLIGYDPLAVTGTMAPVRGFPSMATPSSIIMERMDYDRSFSIDVKFKELDEALAAFQDAFNKFITAPITALIKMITRLFQEAHALIDNLVAKLRNKIIPLKRELDAFIARYLTLIGQGDFNSSVLKCAVNFNMGLSTNILDELLALIESLAAVVQNLVTQLQKLIAEMIEKLLCVPINMVDKLIAQGESYLPSFCKITIPFELGDDLEQALRALRDSSQFRTVTFSGFSADLISYRAIVTTAEDRLNQFNRSSFCQSDLVDRAFNTTLVNLTGGIPSPLKGIPSPF